MKRSPSMTQESIDILDRIKEAKRIHRITTENLAAAAGMSRPTVSGQMNGKFNVDIRVVIAIAKLCPNISAEYLLRGEGSIIKETNSVEERLTRLENLLANK